MNQRPEIIYDIDARLAQLCRQLQMVIYKHISARTPDDLSDGDICILLTEWRLLIKAKRNELTPDPDDLPADQPRGPEPLPG